MADLVIYPALIGRHGDVNRLIGAQLQQPAHLYLDDRSDVVIRVAHPIDVERHGQPVARQGSQLLGIERHGRGCSTTRTVELFDSSSAI